ncbi:rRNA maturation RNase YbeY [Methylobrevis pamukkalensis]|uniref:Endoribonuclease YbeY n=1 Tax=Methylobrevis pamukkalensis TaxID=1439726 RepID=A0A1E3H8M2_9HYPH|nr:rRNA maturation RNase YbeY [Methylobrevis pamukkalensis]ODN72146.1 Endoribonuclease YbeY [Methylobrevis pamukkalensis]
MSRQPAPSSRSAVPPLVVDLVVEAGDWGAEEDLEAMAERTSAAVLARAPQKVRPGTEVTLLFVDDAAIREINREHRGFDKPTNVLSFPMQPPGAALYGPMLGDIVIARETVVREADEAGIPLDHHLAHMMVHGLLHLLGHDHVEADEADAMEALETAILGDLAIPDPYCGTDPV